MNDFNVTDEYVEQEFLRISEGDESFEKLTNAFNKFKELADLTVLLMPSSGYKKNIENSEEVLNLYFNLKETFSSHLAIQLLSKEIINGFLNNLNNSTYQFLSSAKKELKRSKYREHIFFKSSQKYFKKIESNKEIDKQISYFEELLETIEKSC